MATVAQLLGRKPRAIYSVTPDAPVLEAIRSMADHGVGALLVMQGEKLAGIVSERDYARKVILKGRSSSDTPVSQIMTAQVITVEPGQSAQQCMQIMTDRRVRHLPVVEGGRVLGMLSIGDLVRAVLAEQQQTIEQLENYIHH
ncbi:MAG: CBS domain-containing protein [Gammaproteobacteria bacterium]|nr:CBS domain-containing protein [Gammaproteobacteria bacterium]